MQPISDRFICIRDCLKFRSQRICVQSLMRSFVLVTANSVSTFSTVTTKTSSPFSVNPSPHSVLQTPTQHGTHTVVHSDVHDSDDRSRPKLLIHSIKSEHSWSYPSYIDYVRSDTEMTWTAAKEYCADKSMELATIHSAEEQEAAYAVCSSNWLCWLGLNDLETNSVFLWQDGSEPEYENWYPGQPDNNGMEGYNCVLMHSINGQWFDHLCSSSLYALCSSSTSTATSVPTSNPISPGMLCIHISLLFLANSQNVCL